MRKILCEEALRPVMQNLRMKFGYFMCAGYISSIETTLEWAETMTWGLINSDVHLLTKT